MSYCDEKKPNLFITNLRYDRGVNRKILLIALTSVAAIIAIVVLKFGNHERAKSPNTPLTAPSPTPTAPAITSTSDCSSLISEDLEINDNTARGIIGPDRKARVIKGYYSCNKPAHGDIILKSRGSSIPPIVRIMRAVPGDHFKLVQDKEHKRWNIEINEKILMSGDKNNEIPYFFGTETPPTLALYEKPRNGILGPNEVILFSKIPPGSQDSGQFGIISLSDIIGKVELK